MAACQGNIEGNIEVNPFGYTKCDIVFRLFRGHP
jgi:hypothetical protein